MASLTGQTIQSTYDALLKISGNDALTSSLQRITDGLGNFSPLYLSTTAVEISSGLNVVGSITGSNLSGTNTGDETNSTIKSKLGAATSSNDGYLTATDWSTFNAKQNALGYTPVPNTRSLTINGTAYDLSADRSWSVGTVTSVGLSVPTGFAVSNSPVTGSGTLGLSFAAGYSLPTNLSQASWDTAFSSRIATFTTTGNSGAATFSSNTLNIPNYTLSGLGGVPTTRTLTINGTSYDLSADRSWTISTGLSGSGTTNYIPKFTGSTSLGNSLIFDNGTNVGINTTTPSELFEVQRNQNATTRLLISNSDTTNTASRASIRTNSNGVIGEMVSINSLGVYLGAASNHELSLMTNGSQRIVITSGGNVGIGTSSPAARLEVSSGVPTSSEVQRWSYNNANPDFTLKLRQDVSSGLVKHVFDVVNLGTTYSNNLVLTNGNVGIGTSSPSLPLHLYNSAAALAYFETTNANGAYTIWRNSGTSFGDVGSALGISGSGSASDFMVASRSGNMIIGTGSAERMRITSGGNVGIGTATFAGDELVMVSMNGTSNSQAINVKDRNASANSSTFMVFRKSDDTFLGNIRRATTDDALYVGGNSYLALGTGGNTERMRITSGGNVGLNTSSPSYRLDVNGDIRSTGVIRVNTGTIDTVMTFDTGAGAIGTLTNHNLNFWINGTAQAKITTGNQFYVGTGVVDGSAKVQIDSTTQGFLPPRMTSLQRIAITTPAVGLIVYQTDNAGGLGGNEGLYVYKSGGWTFII